MWETEERLSKTMALSQKKKSSWGPRWATFYRPAGSSWALLFCDKAITYDDDFPYTHNQQGGASSAFPLRPVWRLEGAPDLFLVPMNWFMEHTSHRGMIGTTIGRGPYGERVIHRSWLCWWCCLSSWDAFRVSPTRSTHSRERKRGGSVTSTGPGFPTVSRRLVKTYY